MKNLLFLFCLSIFNPILSSDNEKAHKEQANSYIFIVFEGEKIHQKIEAHKAWVNSAFIEVGNSNSKKHLVYVEQGLKIWKRSTANAQILMENPLIIRISGDVTKIYASIGVITKEFDVKQNYIYTLSLSDRNEICVQEKMWKENKNK